MRKGRKDNQNYNKGEEKSYKFWHWVAFGVIIRKWLNISFYISKEIDRVYI